MIVSYTVRLACLSLAVFLLIYGLVGAVVSAVSPVAIRLAQRLRPRTATSLLLALRMLPASAAAIVVGVFCVPSYLWLETESGGEQVGWPCLAAAVLCLGMCAASAINAVRAMLRSRRFIERCERSHSPVLMLAGVFRPRLVISPAVREALSPTQLAAAIGHEESHLRACDNLKRLLFAATPRLPGFRALERAWSRLSEWAADDESVAGDSERSLCLAAALVRVARLGTVAVEGGFLGNGGDLATRVDRLLQPRLPGPPNKRRPTVIATAALAGSFLVLTAQAGTLEVAHRLLEHLAH